MLGGTDRVASCSGVEAVALHLEGHPVVVEVLTQRRRLVHRWFVGVARVVPGDRPRKHGVRGQVCSVMRAAHQVPITVATARS